MTKSIYTQSDTKKSVQPLEKRTSQLGFCDRHKSFGIASFMYIIGGTGSLILLVYFLVEYILAELNWSVINVLFGLLFIFSVYIFVFGLIISKKCFESRD